MEPTPIQRDIIQEEGNTVVLAMPGSGKTFVLSEKIRRILESDLLKDYQGVIAISYTRKASGHLKCKTLQNGTNEKNSFFGTIDSFCLTQIILPFGHYVVGYPKNEVVPITESDLNSDKKIDFEWINKIHPDYEDINESTWENLYGLFKDGKVLVSSLELMALHIIKDCLACRAHLKARFKYVFIDEFQDADTYTNGIFLELIGLGLIGNAVGDVNQSIFGFAHKVSDYLVALETKQGFASYKLTKNFRCSIPIVNYSNRLLDANCQMLDCKEVMGVEHVAVDGDEEKVAEFLDNEIINDCKKWEVTDFGQVAILVRNTRTLKIIDEHLDMPHRVVISTPLDDDLNPRSHLIVQLLQYYFDNKMSFVSVIDSYVDFGLLTPYVRKRLLKIRDEIKSVNEEDMADALPRLFNNVADILLPKYHEGSSIKHLEEVLNTKDLIDSYRPSSTSEVVIMTLHKSKGLEFDVVYHLNMNEFEIPFKKFDNWVAYYPNEVQDLDLHYVGVTRAKKLCVLVSNSIRHNSNGDVKKGEPSVFLSRNGVEVLRKNYFY